MVVYLDVIMLLNFMVDFLLLLGTNSLSGHPLGWKRSALAACFGGVYGGVCLLPGFRFLGNTLWRIVSLLLMGWIAFGCSVSAARRCLLFVLLSMALGGMAAGFGERGFVELLLASAGICLLCYFGFRGKVGKATYLPIEISYGGKSMTLTALYDTGNTLLDPVTGKPVLVVGAEIAQQLLGLNRQQLLSPVTAVSSSLLPGLRLIPYRSVGQAGGLLLALRMQDVKIGRWKGSALVAFAPNALSTEGDYQALTGGIVWG